MIRNSSVATPLMSIGSSVNSFVMWRLETVTFSVALAPPPLRETPPTVAWRSSLTLSCCPPPVATTSTVTVHDAPAASASNPAEAKPLTLIDTVVPPAGAVSVGGSGKEDPPQSVDGLAGEAIARPSGRLSVKLRLVAGDALIVLSIVNVNVLRSPRETALGSNDLTKPGRLIATLSSAVALGLVPALEDRLDVSFV